MRERQERWRVTEKEKVPVDALQHSKHKPLQWMEEDKEWITSDWMICHFCVSKSQSEVFVLLDLWFYLMYVAGLLSCSFMLRHENRNIWWWWSAHQHGTVWLCAAKSTSGKAPQDWQCYLNKFTLTNGRRLANLYTQTQWMDFLPIIAKESGNWTNT